jgi:hypothetical protein
MNRTQILLNETQYHALKKTAHVRKVSIAKLVRDAVDLVYGLSAVNKSRSSLVKLAGIGDGSGQSVARNHDRYLYASK